MGQRPLNATLDRLMMHPQSATHRKERGVFPVGQQHSRPLDPARRLRSRVRYRQKPRQILSSDRQLVRSPPRRHDLRTSLRESKITLPAATNQMNPTTDKFYGIDKLGPPSRRTERASSRPRMTRRRG